MKRQEGRTHLRPIETAWKGYRFRSRLEAKWAVFFDRLDTAWEYEPEGFYLPSGKYLPDFRLAGSLWVEIKPMFGVQSDDIILASELAERTNTPALLLQGDPFEYHARFITTDGIGFDDCRFQECSRCSGELWLAGEDFAHPISINPNCKSEGWPNESEWVARAAEDARGSRFEHGELPQ